MTAGQAGGDRSRRSHDSCLATEMLHPRRGNLKSVRCSEVPGIDAVVLLVAKKKFKKGLLLIIEEPREECTMYER